MTPATPFFARIGIRLLAPALLLAAAPASRAQDPPPLWEALLVETPEPLRYGESAWGDYDGDGDLDLLHTGNVDRFDRPEPFTQLYINNGDFVRQLPDPAGGEGTIDVPGTTYVNALGVNAGVMVDVWRSAVAWGDYDNDGALDAVVTGIDGDGQYVARVYRNTQDERRFEVLHEWAGLADGDVAWGDYDNDGALDFVLTGVDADGVASTRLYRNSLRTNDRFFRVPIDVVGLRQSAVRWGDYDNDLDLDLLVSGIADPQEFVTAVYRNDGDGAFTRLPAELGRLFYASVDWGDFDADGDLDVLVSGADLTPFVLEGRVRVFENTGGSFSSEGISIEGRFEGDPAFGRYRGSAMWGDYNNDGRPDFLVAGDRSTLDAPSGQVYENRGGRRFTKTTVGRFSGRFTGATSGSAFWGDYDDDGDLDLFSTGEDPARGAVVTSFRNYLPFYPPNEAPVAPRNLSATVQGRTVTLAWGPGADSSTPEAGLSYNIRVGRMPGGVEVVSPMASVESGRRLITARGNADGNRSWVLKKLEPGTYYWSVQTLDASFKGSPFAEEGTFTILP